MNGIMKYKRAARMLSLVVVLSFAATAQADLEMFFFGYTEGSATDLADLEAQMSLTVSEVDADTALFSFHNALRRSSSACRSAIGPALRPSRFRSLICSFNRSCSLGGSFL